MTDRRHHEEDFARPEDKGDSVLDPAERSFFLPGSTADEATTYFYGQMFAMDAEIRAMFPPAMDQQRMRFFRTRIAASQADPARLVPYLRELVRVVAGPGDLGGGGVADQVALSEEHVPDVIAEVGTAVFGQDRS